MMKYLLSPRGSFTIIFSLIIAMSSPTSIMGLYNNNTLFNRAGFIMTHNSATGEDPSGISGCNNQGSDNMVAQLNCGAVSIIIIHSVIFSTKLCYIIISPLLSYITRNTMIYRYKHIPAGIRLPPS